MLLRVFLDCALALSVGGGHGGHENVLGAGFLDQAGDGGEAAAALRLAAHGAVRGGRRVDMRALGHDLTDGPAVLGIAHANDHLDLFPARLFACFLPFSSR